MLANVQFGEDTPTVLCVHTAVHGGILVSIYHLGGGATIKRGRGYHKEGEGPLLDNIQGRFLCNNLQVWAFFPPFV